MGGGYSIDTPECPCKATQGDLPYEVYEAARTGHTKPVIAYLKTKGGDVNAHYKQDTMLHEACANGRENILALLLNEKSLCLNLRNGYNETALMLAARNGYRDCVEILVVHNHRCPLQIFAKNCYEEDAVDIAHKNNCQDVTYFLQSYIKDRPPVTGGKVGLQPSAPPHPGGAHGYDAPPKTTKPPAQTSNPPAYTSNPPAYTSKPPV